MDDDTGMGKDEVFHLPIQVGKKQTEVLLATHRPPFYMRFWIFAGFSLGKIIKTCVKRD